MICNIMTSLASTNLEPATAREMIIGDRPYSTRSVLGLILEKTMFALQCLQQDEDEDKDKDKDEEEEKEHLLPFHQRYTLKFVGYKPPLYNITEECGQAALDYRSVFQKLSLNSGGHEQALYNNPSDGQLQSGSVMLEWLPKILVGSGAFATLMPLLPYQSVEGSQVPTILFKCLTPVEFNTWVISTIVAFSTSLIGLKLMHKRPKFAWFCCYFATLSMLFAVAYLILAAVISLSTF